MTINKRIKTILAGFVLVGLVPFTAAAQFDTSSNSPIKIAADNLDYQGTTTVLTGGVDVRQGDVRILADRMELLSASNGALGQGNFSSIIANGNFYYLTKDQEVRGNKGVYTKKDETFVVTGDVILKQDDGNVVTGEKLYYNLDTQNARVVGTCKGRRCGSNGRVNILIKNTDGLSAGTN